MCTATAKIWSKLRQKRSYSQRNPLKRWFDVAAVTNGRWCRRLAWESFIYSAAFTKNHGRIFLKINMRPVTDSKKGFVVWYWQPYVRPWHYTFPKKHTTWLMFGWNDGRTNRWRSFWQMVECRTQVLLLDRSQLGRRHSNIICLKFKVLLWILQRKNIQPSEMSYWVERLNYGVLSHSSVDVFVIVKYKHASVKRGLRVQVPKEGLSQGVEEADPLDK